MITCFRARFEISHKNWAHSGSGELRVGIARGKDGKGSLMTSSCATSHNKTFCSRPGRDMRAILGYGPETTA